MQSEVNQQRLNLIYQMLLEMAAGNFAFRVPRTADEGELEALTVLLNWLAEELKESVFHLGFVNPHFTYQFIIHSIWILDSDYVITHISSDVPELLRIESKELKGHKFDRLLSDESLSVWETLITNFQKNQTASSTVKLNFRSKNDLTVVLICTVSRLSGSESLFVSSVSTLTEYTASHHQEPLTGNSHAIQRQQDIRLMQSVYDYVLANMDSSLPPLKKLARIFNTNQTKLKSGFKEMFNTSIHQFYNDERLKRAYLLIEQTNIPLKNIGTIVGFSTYPNFSRAFKIKFGYPPTSVHRKVF